MQFDSTLRNAILSAVATALSGGTVDFRTGSPPGVGTVSGTLLGTLTGLTFGSPSAGAVTFTSTPDSSGDASGTPGHANMKDSGGTVRIQATAAIGSGEWSFSGAVSLGGPITESSGTLTAGNP